MAPVWYAPHSSYAFTVLPHCCCCLLLVDIQVALRVALRAADELERSGASHMLAAFCASNNMGQMALLSTMAPAGEGACCAMQMHRPK